MGNDKVQKVQKMHVYNFAFKVGDREYAFGIPSDSHAGACGTLVADLEAILAAQKNSGESE